jgi:L-amino acid N-acyltransferase YncA
MENVTIRIATEKDLAGILEIYNDAIVNTTAIYNYDKYTNADIQQWFADKKKTGQPVFVADIDNRVAGFVSYGPFRVRPAYKYSIEHSVYVHPDFRKRGLAKILLKKIIDVARENNFHAIVAGIDADNKISIELHKQFDFIEVGHIKQVGYKFGRWLDLTFMELLLDTPEKPKEN